MSFGRRSPVHIINLTQEELDKAAARRRQRADYIEKELVDLQLGSHLKNTLKRMTPATPESREVSRERNVTCFRALV
jgi:hypothetical protein